MFAHNLYVHSIHHVLPNEASVLTTACYSSYGFPAALFEALWLAWASTPPCKLRRRSCPLQHSRSRRSQREYDMTVLSQSRIYWDCIRRHVTCGIYCAPAFELGCGIQRRYEHCLYGVLSRVSLHILHPGAGFISRPPQFGQFKAQLRSRGSSLLSASDRGNVIYRGR